MFGNPVAKIEKLAQKKDGDGIVHFLHDKNREVVLAAIKGLGQAGGEEAFNNLTTMLRDPDAALRAASAGALEIMRDPKAAAFISHRLPEETDAAAKAAMQKALGALHEEKM